MGVRPVRGSETVGVICTLYAAGESVGMNRTSRSGCSTIGMGMIGALSSSLTCTSGSRAESTTTLISREGTEISLSMSMIVAGTGSSATVSVSMRAITIGRSSMNVIGALNTRSGCVRMSGRLHVGRTTVSVRWNLCDVQRQ